MQNKHGTQNKPRPSFSLQIIREPYEYICQVKGKGVRLLLINAFDLWLHIPPENKTEIGVLTQMLHNASLLYVDDVIISILLLLLLLIRIDDIEDNSKLRRGIPGIM